MNIAIVTCARSGSNWLSSLFDDNENNMCWYEIFNPIGIIWRIKKYNDLNIINFFIDELDSLLNNYESQRLKNQNKNINSLLITYEELCNNYKESIKKINIFLDYNNCNYKLQENSLFLKENSIINYQDNFYNQIDFLKSFNNKNFKIFIE